MNYIETIKTAILFFPVIAFFVAIPFILVQYHRYGSVSFFKSLLIYSFILYMICAYFLVILPLPDRDAVALLTTPRVQFIPFSFIIDFVKNISKYGFGIIKTVYLYVPSFNVLLTMPFGMYLRYYFKLDFKHTILYTFLLSLFFELTQLSGLYFIYPRSYRLFDIDDLMLNTVGGIFGYLIIGLFIKKLPTIEKLNLKAREKGKKISGFKRTTSFFLDLFLFSIVIINASIVFHDYYNYIYGVLLLVYYVFVPYILKGRTLAQMFLNLKVVTLDDKNNLFKLLLRIAIFVVIYLVIPYLFFALAYYVENADVNNTIKLLIGMTSLGIVFLIYGITSIKYLFTNKPMLYEKLSKTKIISTIE